MAENSSLEGLKELTDKLKELDRVTSGKALRSAAMVATTPVVKGMKLAAPVGKKAHRTYKGRLVAPGFLRRSVKRKSKIKDGVVSVVIGVAKEAFYGILFVEKGTKPHLIPKKTKKKPTTMAFGGRVVSSVNHPGAKATPWFVSTFTSKRSEMEQGLVKQLRKRINKVAKK